MLVFLLPCKSVSFLPFASFTTCDHVSDPNHWDSNDPNELLVVQAVRLIHCSGSNIKLSCNAICLISSLYIFLVCITYTAQTWVHATP